MRLENFEGWDDFQDEDLFATMSQNELEKDEEDLPENSDSEDQPEEEGEEVEIEEQEGSSEDLFTTSEDFVEGEQSSSDISDEDEPEGYTKKFYSYLKNKGFISDEEEPEEISDEYIEDKLNSKVENSIEEMLTSLPEPVKQLNRYVMNGGNVEDFLQEIMKNRQTEISADMDIEQEKNQISVMRNKLSKEGYDEDYIEAQLEFLKTSGNLEKLSKKEFEKFKAEKESYLQKIAEAKRQERVQEEINIKESKKNITTFLQKEQYVGDLKISNKDKTELANYLEDKNVTLKNGTNITSFQKDLFYDMQNNETLRLQVAMLLKNRNEDGTLNFEGIKKDIKTKQTKSLKEDIQRSKKKNPSTSNTQGRKQRNFYEYMQL